MKSGLIKALLWLWQLPQNLVGLVMSFVAGRNLRYLYPDGDIGFYVLPLPAGVCLGEYIFIHKKLVERFRKSECTKKHIEDCVKHEAGHRRQSRMLGLLYLPVIGLPSLLGNLYSRAHHKNSRWYYRQPWEAWADRLGGVSR